MQRKQHKGKKNIRHTKQRQKKEHRVTIPRATPGVPDSEVVDLKYRADFRVQGASTLAARWVTNGAYDADPSLGGQKYEYFDWYSTVYAFNRVQSYKIDLTLSNSEFNPVQIDMCHLNIDPGVTGVNYPAYALMPYGHTEWLAGASSGKSQMHYSKILSVQNVVGDRQVVTTERYVGSSTANPADLTYFGFSVQDPVGSLTAGVFGTIVITIRVKFYDRKNIADITMRLKQPELVKKEPQGFALLHREEKQ